MHDITVLAECPSRVVVMRKASQRSKGSRRRKSGLDKRVRMRGYIDFVDRERARLVAERQVGVSDGLYVS